MNTKGHPATLVRAHPGNLNAAKAGVHSPRLIEARASEIVDELGLAEGLDEAGRLTLREYARVEAVIEAIDRDLSERGLTDRNGKERYLLQRRERFSRRLTDLMDRLVEAQSRTRKLEARTSSTEIAAGRSDYLNELRSIALGYESAARVSERLAALKLLLELSRGELPEGWMHPLDPGQFEDDASFQGKVRKLKADLEEARKAGILSNLERDITNAYLGF